MKMERKYLELNSMNEKSPVIVVEGKTDIAKLEKITNAILISTNGSSVPRETLDYIKELSKERRVIVLTDPDYPGLRIRNIINQEIPNAYNAFVSRDKASNGKKLENIYSLIDLYELGLVGQDNSSYLREKVFTKYHLGYGNAKTLIKRLSSIGLEKEELKEFLKEIVNENSK